MVAIFANPIVRRIAYEVTIALASWILGLAIVNIAPRVWRFARAKFAALRERRAKKPDVTLDNGIWDHPVPAEPTELILVK